MIRKPLLALSALIACMAVFVQSATATIIWWDPNGTTSVGGNGTWNSSSLVWSPISLQTNANLIAWVPADAAGFCAGPSSSSQQGVFFITNNTANLGFAGIFNGSQNPGPCDVTILGSGSLSLASGAQAFSTFNPSLGFTRIQVPITGTGQIVAESTGQLFLEGVNTYSGGTVLGFSGASFSGILNFNNASSFGSGAITLQSLGNGGALVLEGSSAVTIANSVTVSSVTTNNIVGNTAGLKFSGPWTLSSNVQIGSGGGANNIVEISGAISGAFSFSKMAQSPSGILKLSGANTYTGATTNFSGTLMISGAGKLNGGNYTGAISNGGVFNYASSANQILGGIISGSGSLVVDGPGTLTNSGANTYTGTTTINGGVLTVGADTGLGAAPGAATPAAVTINGGTLRSTASGSPTFPSANRGITVGANGATIDVVTSGAIMVDTSGQPIIGAGNTVTKTGVGTFRAPSASTFSKLVVNGGLWQGAVDTVFGAVPGSFTANAITLNGGGISVNAGFTLSANRGITLGASGGTVDGASSPVLPMIITGSGNLTKTGTGTATLSGVNTYSGKTIVSGGQLTINTSGDAALGAAPASYVADQLTLGANTTFSLGSAANTTLNVNRGITLGGAVTFSLSSKDLTVPGIIAGTGGSLTKSGANALILSGANTFDGGVLQTGGTLTVNNNSALGTGTVTITPAGICTVAGKSGTTVLANNIVVNAGGGQVIDFFATSGNALTLNGQISGAANIYRGNGGGSGNLTLNGDNSGFTGNLNLQQGPLVLGHKNALGTGTLIVTPGAVAISLGANTALTGANAVTNNVTLNGALPVNTSSDLELSGVLSGASGALTKSGAGTLILDAAETYAGATTVSAGTLALNGTASLATSALTIGSAGTLDVSSLASSTYTPGVALTAISSASSSATLNGASGGVVDAGSTNINLSFAPTTFNGDLTHPALSISQGTLSVNGDIINVTNTAGTLLGGGTYTVIKQASGNITVVSAPTLGVVSGLAAGATRQLVVNGGEIDLVVTVPATFSALTASQTNSYGTASISLSGVVSGAGPNYPADGDTVSVTINGNTQNAVTTGGNGSFSLTFPTATLSASGTPYTITYSYAGAGVLSAGNNTTTSLKVTPAALTVTANGQSKVYGQTIATGAGQTQFSSSGLQNLETIGSVTLAVSGGGDGANAPVAGSPYTITPGAATGGTFNANNYNISYATGNLTVSAATLTVTATGTLTYGEDPSNAVYAVNYATLQGTDTVAVISGSANFSTDATATNYIGTNYIAHVVDTGTLSSPNYTFVAGLDGVLTITNRPLYATNILGNDKIYDATTAATADFSGAGLTNFVNGDDASISLVTSNAVATFVDKNAGSNKTVTVTGLAAAGDLGTNYFVAPAMATASIGQLTLSVGATGFDKTYDATNIALVSLSVTPLGTDSVTATYMTATFADKNVGVNKTISVAGIEVIGPDAANYTAAPTTTTTATISPASLTVTATGDDKTYNGTTVATATLSDNRIAGDVLTDSYTGAAFADKNVNTGIAVAVSDISISGTDAGNYALANTTASTSANITARALTVSATGINKVYDGTTAATVNLSDDKVSGDAVSDSYTSATFADKNVNTGIAVAVTGISISGGDAGNYSLVNATASTTANITATGLTVTGELALDKVYDGTTNATVIFTNAALMGVQGSDDVTLVTSNAAAAFTDKNVGSNKVVTVTALSIVGADAGNYSFASSLTTNASITPATLTVSAAGVNKVYASTTAATVNLSDDKIAGDAVSDSYTSAAFADKNVSTGIAVSVSGISISGADSGNYTLASTTANTTADITVRSLTVSASGINKVYNGNAAATVTLSDDKVSGDAVTDSYTSASFADKNAGAGKAVSVSGISISGADSGNYSLANTTASTTADITARLLTVSATAANKVYDGTTTTTATLSDDKVLGDDVSEADTAANFADANGGTGKTVTVTGISISGADTNNYTLASTTAMTTANITALASTAGIVSSVNPSIETSNVTFTATISAGVGTPAGDVVFLANGTPFSTNTLVAGAASASTASLPVGTNAIAVQYAAQGNYLGSSANLDQVVNSAVTLSTNNVIASIVNNGNGTYTINAIGTPTALYYLQSTADLNPPVSWNLVPASTNTAATGTGKWSFVVTNAPPAYYRSTAVNPAP